MKKEWSAIDIELKPHKAYHVIKVSASKYAESHSTKDLEHDG